MKRGSMVTGPTARIVKRLFATCGNQCAFPMCHIPMVDPREGTVIGEICHIKGRKPDAKRYDLTQSPEERHGFDNLMLLCGNHHTVIDSDEVAYTVERLHQMKRDHEAKYAGGSEPNDEIAQGLLAKLLQDIHEAVVQTGPQLNAAEKSGRYMQVLAAMKQDRWYQARDLLIGLEGYKNVPELASTIGQECTNLDHLAEEAADAYECGDLVSLIRVVGRMGKSTTDDLTKQVQQAWQQLAITGTVIHQPMQALDLGGVSSIAVAPKKAIGFVGFSRGIKDLHLARRTLSSYARRLTGKVMVMAPDGESVFCGYATHNVVRLQTESLGQLGAFELSSLGSAPPAVTSLAINTNGQILFVGHESGAILVWDVQSQNQTCRCTGHSGRINALVPLPNSAGLLSAAGDGTMKIWDVDVCKPPTGAKAGRHEINEAASTFGEPHNPAKAVGIIPGGQRAITAHENNTLKVWDLSLGRVIHDFGDTGTNVSSLVVTPAGTQALTGNEDGCITIWDLATGGRLRDLYPPSLAGQTPLRGQRAVTALYITPDGHTVISGDQAGCVCWWTFPAGLLAGTS
jgi:hypothetical protein